ncbi:LytR family transcriptional regulator [Micrococcus lylae]|uniref:LytR family transcriptional regulator n=1 Tax=Micrococcus lylae TaxID=1273 RepID=A0ABY2K2I7_9MICC|nr:LytR family transcriptional regulator [Micrococcus lylae]
MTSRAPGAHHVSHSTEQTTEPNTGRRPRRRRRGLMVVVGVLLLALIAAGAVVAVYVGGIAKTVDDVKKFEGSVFPEESLRPQFGGGAGQGRGDGAEDGSGGGTSEGSGGAEAGGNNGSVVMPEATGPGDVQGPEASSSDEEIDGKAVNFLLLGADSGDLTDGEDTDIARITGIGRSDTMMWVHVPGDRENIQVMSIMRDTWLPIRGHGDRKLNAAYQLGGVPLAVSTIENMFQARVDHVVAVDMVGFRDLVNALGGVDLYNPRAFTSGRHSFAEGNIHLSGEEAIVYARERYAFGDGDYSRVENQQRLVKAIITKAMSRTTLTDPNSVRNSVNALAPYLTFDESLDSGRLFDLAWSMRNVRSDDINVSTVPTLGAGWAGDQAVVWPDWASIRRIGEGIRTGTLDEVLDQ